MTTNQLRAIFNGNKNDNPVSVSNIVDIGQYVTVKPNITEDGMDYYYSIDLLELSKSNLPEDTLKEMIKGGWSMDKKGQKIVKFC